MLPFMIHDDDSSSVHVLIRKNLYSELENKISENPELVNYIDADVTGDTPLGTAAYDKKNGPLYIKLLLSHGADPNLSSGTPGSRLPLEIACETGSSESAKLLLEGGADINTVCSDGKSVFFKAFNVNEDLVRIFLEKGVLIKQENHLFQVIFKGYSYELFRMLSEKGEDLFFVSGNGSTLLHYSALFGREDIAGFLISSGLDIERTDSSGRTPLFSGCTGSIRIMKIAGIGGGVEIPAFYASEKTVRLLLDKGADINHRDNNGINAFHLASKYGHFDILKLLDASGADIFSADNYGFNALHYAAQGVDVNIQGSEFKPYHADNPALAEYLIARGFDINSRTSQGETALDIALRSKASRELVSVLK